MEPTRAATTRYPLGSRELAHASAHQRAPLPEAPGAHRRAAFPTWGLTELVVALRWAALVLALLVMLLSRRTGSVFVTALVLSGYALLRTIWPVQLHEPWPYIGRRATVSRVAGPAAEVVLCSLAVAATGGARSPFLLSLGVACFLAGLRVSPAVLVGTAVSLLALFTAEGAAGLVPGDTASQDVERVALLAAVAMLGSYGEWLLGDRRREDDGELERMASMGDINHLLLELHERAAALPASVSLRSAVTGTVSRLEELLHPDVVVLMLNDPTAEASDTRWQVTIAKGVQLPDVVASTWLPRALLDATRSLAPVHHLRLGDGDGVAVHAETGIYAPLWARGTLIGLMATERCATDDPFSSDDVDLVASVARHAALAIDNARWFHRLRSLGADEERGRIARELHDKLGQDLAFVAISLDRSAFELAGDTATPARNRELATELTSLAATVRATLGEIRDKLTDLRLDALDADDLETALVSLLDRVERRSGISTSFEAEGDCRLAPVTEHEIVRIAKEAIVNAERHSRACRISVRWRHDGDGASLEVVDDGTGMAATAQLRRDAFGILGMRERADAIGASLRIVSLPGRGTTVRLHVVPRRRCP